MDSASLAPKTGEESTSTRSAIGFVYLGYAFRYLYLLVLVPFYGRVLGPTEYGRLLAAMSLYQIIWLLVEYGLPMAGIRDVAAAKTPEARAMIYRQHFWARVLTSLVGVGIGVGATMLSPVLRERPIFGVLATLAGLVMAFHLGWFFQGVLRFKTSVVLEMLGFAINLPLILYFVRGPEDGWLVLLVILASGMLVNIVAYRVAHRAVEGAAPKCGWREGAALLRLAVPLFAQRSIVTIAAHSVTYIVSIFSTPAVVGWYGAAERFCNVGLSLLVPANQVLIGTVSHRLASHALVGSAYRIIRSALLLLPLLGLVMLGGAFGLADPVLPWILGPGFEPSVAILQVLALLFPLMALERVVTGYILVPLRLDQLVWQISLLSGLASIVLVLALVKPFGGLGVAWARVAAAAATAVVALIVVKRQSVWGELFPSRR